MVTLQYIGVVREREKKHTSSHTSWERNVKKRQKFLVYHSRSRFMCDSLNSKLKQKEQEDLCFKSTQNILFFFTFGKLLLFFFLGKITNGGRKNLGGRWVIVCKILRALACTWSLSPSASKDGEWWLAAQLAGDCALRAVQACFQLMGYFHCWRVTSS